MDVKIMNFKLYLEQEIFKLRSLIYHTRNSFYVLFPLHQNICFSVIVLNFKHYIAFTVKNLWLPSL